MTRVRVVYGRKRQAALPGMGENPHAEGLGWTYETNEELNVGDVVLVPPSWVHPEPQEATVIGIGSDYTGPVKRILRVIERDQ